MESYAGWMARIDAQVDDMARKMERQPPTYTWLHSAQRRIVQMLIEHLRSLPELKSGESALDKPDPLRGARLFSLFGTSREPENCLWLGPARFLSTRLFGGLLMPPALSMAAGAALG